MTNAIDRGRSSTTATVEKVLDDIHRVRTPDAIVGYVLVTENVFVSLRGSVFNTSVEVGQSRDLEAAVQLLLRSS